ncbi:MAG: FtsX-like permease family protein [Candidatus Bathyarchaeia archaeon]
MKWRSGSSILMIFLLLIIILSYLPPVAYSQPELTGIVVDSSSKPLEGAVVAAWRGENLLSEVVTDATGRFKLEVESPAIITVYMDMEDTPGFDYLPALFNFTGGDTLDITLKPAATLEVVGDIQYVVSEELPLGVSYAIQDEGGSILNLSGYPLIFGSKKGYTPYANRYLLDRGNVCVPANEPINICVNTSILVVSEVKTKTMLIEHSPVSPGTSSTFDIKPSIIEDNLDIVDSIRGEVGDRIEEMEELGFFLPKQREMAASGTRWLIQSKQFFEEDAYTQSYDAAKRGYIDFRNAMNELESMYRDASFSVYILLAFLALTSITISQLLTDETLTKLVVGVTINMVSLTLLYFVYPGSNIIPLKNYMSYAALFFAASIALFFILPRMMKGRGGDGHVPVRNLLVPVFSIAKRSLNRRSLRFLLTLSSIIILVMSFVALTSFSEGYGLMIKRVSQKKVGLNGVLVRDSAWKEGEPSFIPPREVGWIKGQKETFTASPKAENLPQLRAITSLNGRAVMGIIGIDATSEQSIVDLRSTLLRGDLPSEDGLIISEELREELQVEVGDTLKLGLEDITLEGVFRGEELIKLAELDGSSYLPRKMVNINPEGEVPILVEESCTPHEIVVMHISRARETSFMGISRISITAEKGVDLIEYAERLALERGFRTWASTKEGIYLAQLGSYLEGKGLPLLIPWIIVVLNVIITMLNSLYERRGEISILSSVGLNPAQIAAIFVAEASIIGLIAGGCGYLGGLGLYKVMAITGVSLEVHQKVSAFWSVASIALAISAVLTGAFAALKNSVVITPSLNRRWRIDGDKARYNEPWTMEIPVKILPEERRGFIDYLMERLKSLEDHPTRMTSQIKLVDEGQTTKIEFVYRASQSTTGNFYTKNTVQIMPQDGINSVKLYSMGEQNWVHDAGSLIRMMAMEWSTGKG